MFFKPCDVITGLTGKEITLPTGDSSTGSTLLTTGRIKLRSEQAGLIGKGIQSHVRVFKGEKVKIVAFVSKI